jgi:hypothetical protein
MVFGLPIAAKLVEIICLHTIFEADDVGLIPFTHSRLRLLRRLRLGKPVARRLPRRSCEATQAGG